MTGRGRRTGWPLGLAAVGLLWAASPPGLFPGAGWLVLPGLGAFYAVATTSSRPLAIGYLLGLLHMLCFSWSLRHVTVAGYLAIGVIGGLYFLLTVAWTRADRRCLPRSVAFACGLAATAWLRAHLPEIHYPHGQPAHDLYRWPLVLGPVRWGGEVLQNALCALVAAAAVDLYRSWRTALPPFARALSVAAAGAGTWLALCVVPPPGAGAGAGAGEGQDRVRVAVVEPGFGPAFQFDPALFARGLRERLVPRTVAVAGPSAVDPPDLVLWPESAYPLPLDGEPAELAGPAFAVPLARDTLLLAGTIWRGPDGRRAVAALLDGRGRLRGLHEKIVAVPGGERLPFIALLPKGVREALFGWGRGIVGGVPDLVYGTVRPPLATARGVPFAAMVCYDNAFDGVARAQVAAGARFLCVLSNESWYQRGAELDQMAAMTVFRALETATPVIRSTVDGASLAVGADGREIAALPVLPDDRTETRVLSVEIAVGPGALPPLAWLSVLCVVVVLATGWPLIPQRLRSWAKLPPVRRSSGRAEPGVATDSRAVERRS